MYMSRRNYKLPYGRVAGLVTRYWKGTMDLRRQIRFRSAQAKEVVKKYRH